MSEQTQLYTTTEPADYFLNILKNKIDDIDPQALHILKKLKDNQFEGYLVGGGVRDLLVGLKPKDFDIATNALPQQVKRKIQNCFIIGRRFKLVHARRGDKIFEIATYRREATPEEIEALSNKKDEPANFVEENFFGTLIEDSFRRDFTINALFFDPHENKLIDHCNGLADISNKTLRMIGEPVTRIKEDPVRILRALRLSQKLGFHIEPTLREAIYTHITELSRAVLPRRREEWLKIIKLNNLESVFYELYDLGVLHTIAPTLHTLFEHENQREEFLSYLNKFKNLGFDLTSSTEIFAGILYSFIIATNIDHKNLSPLEMKKILDEPHIQKLAKEELGIFKIELTAIEQTFSFIHSLQNPERYSKKGDRRKSSFLNNTHFLLSLKLGQLSYALSPNHVYFWQREVDHHLLHQI